MKLKRLLSAAAAVVAAIVMTVPAFAATGINAQEARLLEKLQTKVTTKAGATLSLPDNYISQARTYMSSKTDLTKAEVDEMIGYIDSTIEVIKDSDAKNLTELMQSEKSAIVGYAQKVAGVIGLTLSYNNISKVVTVYDADGNVIFRSGNLIKATGGVSATAAAGAVGAIVVAAGAAAVIFARKRMNAHA